MSSIAAAAACGTASASLHLQVTPHGAPACSPRDRTLPSLQNTYQSSWNCGDTVHWSAAGRRMHTVAEIAPSRTRPRSRHGSTSSSTLVEISCSRCKCNWVVKGLQRQATLGCRLSSRSASCLRSYFALTCGCTCGYSAAPEPGVVFLRMRTRWRAARDVSRQAHCRLDFCVDLPHTAFSVPFKAPTSEPAYC